MKTLVYQSYRRSNVPTWINTCMRTVQCWAAQHIFDYRFLDDEFFDCVPTGFRQRVRHDLVPMSDLARLEWTRRFLQEGYDRVIWVDADVIVFDPGYLTIDIDHEFAFCEEIWIDRDAQGHFRGDRRINNAVSVFTQHNSFLSYYRYACLELARCATIPLNKISFGTAFLTHQDRILPLPVLKQVGMISPPMLHHLAHGNFSEIEAVYAQYLTTPLAAANVCGSFLHRRYDGLEMNNDVFERAIQKLIYTRGAIINQFVCNSKYRSVTNRSEATR